uniref:T-box domain-containing protein n=1 Tax=Oryzias melastigma TaxID=30732 RepID=A0A3B3CIR5_ORYME
MTSASDGPTSTETSVISISNSPSWSSASPLNSFGDLDAEKDFPPVMTIKGVTVTLENNSVWKQFSSCGTEMILTKQGRRMFPYCRYRLSGLDPNMMYMLVLSIVPSTKHRYRWNSSQWEVSGQGEHLIQGTIRAFSHHYSPCRGSDWMNSLVSFYKLKLTNNFQDQDGHIILHSMHRYIPKLHIVPLPNGVLPKTDQPVQMGPESITFTFPQTEFMAVTTYQNFRITQLKINHNPFAKGFRDEWKNGRLKETFLEPRAMVSIDAQHVEVKPAEPSEDEEETDKTPALCRVRRKKKRINRHWGNPKGKNYKPSPAPPAVPCSPLLQPELDDIDGLLFVSFISKVENKSVCQRLFIH